MTRFNRDGIDPFLFPAADQSFPFTVVVLVVVVVKKCQRWDSNPRPCGHDLESCVLDHSTTLTGQKPIFSAGGRADRQKPIFSAGQGTVEFFFAQKTRKTRKIRPNLSKLTESVGCIDGPTLRCLRTFSGGLSKEKLRFCSDGQEERKNGSDGKKMALGARLELATIGLLDQCSTD